jgi:hypothetical protein
MLIGQRSVLLGAEDGYDRMAHQGVALQQRHAGAQGDL